MIPNQIGFRPFILISAFCLLSILPVIAKPIYTVVGTVKQADGKLAPTGLKVVVTNTTQQLTAETVLGLQQRGKLQVSMVSIDNKLKNIVSNP